MKKRIDAAQRMKIAIVAPTLGYVGGHSVQAELLMRLWQDDARVEATFIAIDPPLPRWGAWAKRIRGLRTLLREPYYLINLWQGLADVDLAHIFASSYWSFLVAAAPVWLVSKLRGAKTLVNYHSGDARDHLSRFPSAKFVMSKADRVIAPTIFLVEVLGEFGIQARAIPNVVDLSRFRFRLRRPLRPHLICPRGFLPYYCIDVVVRAYAEIKRAYPESSLDLIGGGKLEREIRNLVTSLNLRGVRFTGVASRQQIGEYYDQADIFINASSVDAMPVSVIEAFRAGTPVVTTAPEAMPYLVEHERTGLLSPVGNEKALAANVIRLLRDDELATSMAQNASQESRKYEWSVVRDKWLNVYREVIDDYASSEVPSGGSVRDLS